MECGDNSIIEGSLCNKLLVNLSFFSVLHCDCWIFVGMFTCSPSDLLTAKYSIDIFKILAALTVIYVEVKLSVSRYSCDLIIELVWRFRPLNIVCFSWGEWKLGGNWKLVLQILYILPGSSFPDFI